MDPKVIAVILVTVSQLLTTITASGPPTPAHYQNLTAILNEALADKTSETMSNLRSMLQLSPLVYYETDLLLQDIDQLVPVIDLLEDAKPSDSEIQIKLVLNYIDFKTGILKPKRLLDVYFKPKLFLSSTTKSKITQHVTSIAVNLLPPTTNFYWRPSKSDFKLDTLTNDTLWKVSEREPLVNYVKNFLHFHFGNTSKIPVGIVVSAFDRIIFKNDTFMSRQWNASDFVTLQISQMPSINPEHWNHSLKGQREYAIPRDSLIPVEVLINFNENWWPLPEVSYTFYRNTLLESLKNSRFFNETSRNLATKLDNSVRSLYAKFVLNWAMVNNHGIILSYPYGILPYNAGTEVPGNIIPSFKKNPIGNHFTQFKDNVTNVMGKYREVIFNEETWGALIRNSDQLKGWKTAGSLNAIVEWTLNGQESWYLLEDYMNSLVLKENTPDGVYLSTLVFNQSDIQTSSGIRDFLMRNEALNVSIGCSLSFSEVFLDDINGAGNAFRTRASENLCSPLFSSVKTMIWKVDGNVFDPYSNFGSKGFLDSYFYVILARKIFLQEFPDKQVIIEFNSGRYSKSVFKIYEAMFAVDFTK